MVEVKTVSEQIYLEKLKKRALTAFNNRKLITFKPIKGEYGSSEETEQRARERNSIFKGLPEGAPITIKDPTEKDNEVFVSTLAEFKDLVRITRRLLGFEEIEQAVEIIVKHETEHVQQAEEEGLNFVYCVEFFENKKNGRPSYVPSIILSGVATHNAFLRIFNAASNPSQSDKILGNI